MPKSKREKPKERYRRIFLNPNYNYWQLALFCSAAGAIIGKDGIKSGLSLLCYFVIIGCGAWILSYIEDRR